MTRTSTLSGREKKVCIAHSQFIVRMGLKCALEADLNFHLIDAHKSHILINFIISEEPDVIVVQSDFPETDGFSILTLLRRHGLMSRVVFFDTEWRREDLLAAVDRGVAGFIALDDCPESIARTVVQAAENAAAILPGEPAPATGAAPAATPPAAMPPTATPPAAAPPLPPLPADLGHAPGHAPRDTPGDDQPAGPASREPWPAEGPGEGPAERPGERPGEAGVLTARELQILRLLARGATIRETAKVLSVSPSTVKNHRHALYAKLNVANACAAIDRARNDGLLG
jgi:DNA-binding NarL/FixJ family response regulator